jgi:DNA (cytosine-5)-methyltransferase 1
MGYNRAGFEVVGVDLDPQPNYPFEFHQADALTYPLDGFDAIHASPPCKLFSGLAALHPSNPLGHVNLLTPTLARLADLDVPWVVENVPGAPMTPTVVLCGSMFGLGVRRHRLFATNFTIPQPECRHAEQGRVVTVHGHPGGTSTRSGPLPTSADWRRAMGSVEWMTVEGLAQSIPPAYTEYIGRHCRTALGATTSP